jgi:surface protein
MYSMFRGCSTFNQSVTNFDTAKVTNMAYMFVGCTAFNQSVANFDTAKVTNMEYMFYGCTAFNQDLSAFDITSLTDATNMLQGSAFTQTNYDLLLVAWEAQTEQPNVPFHAGSAKYGSGAPATARAALVSSGWTITDGGPA